MPSPATVPSCGDRERRRSRWARESHRSRKICLPPRRLDCVGPAATGGAFTVRSRRPPRARQDGCCAANAHRRTAIAVLASTTSTSIPTPVASGTNRARTVSAVAAPGTVRGSTCGPAFDPATVFAGHVTSPTSIRRPSTEGARTSYSGSLPRQYRCAGPNGPTHASRMSARCSIGPVMRHSRLFGSSSSTNGPCQPMRSASFRRRGSARG